LFHVTVNAVNDLPTTILLSPEDGISRIDDEGLESLPTALKLGSVYPNPFNDIVGINFVIPELILLLDE